MQVKELCRKGGYSDATSTSGTPSTAGWKYRMRSGCVTGERIQTVAGRRARRPPCVEERLRRKKIAPQVRRPEIGQMVEPFDLS